MSTLALQHPELIHRLEQLAVDYNTLPEKLLDRAVQEFVEKMEQQFSLPKPEQPSAPPEFLKEVAAFERLKPELLKQYQGRAVAIYQEKVVAVGDDVLETHEQVVDQLGDVICYVELVRDDTPRKVRITSSRIKR